MKEFAHLRNMLLSAQSALDRSLQGPTESHHAHQPTDLDLLDLLVLHRRDLARFAGACLLRPRRAMLLPAHITLLLHILHRSLRRLLLHLRFTSSSHLNQPASPIQTMALMLAVSLVHHLHPQLVLLDQGLRLPTKGHCRLMVALQALHQKCVLLLRIELVRPAMDTLAHTIILILRATAASPVELHHLPLPWLLLKLLLVTEMIVPQPLHQNDTVSGKTTSTSTKNLHQTRRSVRSLKSHTAVVQPHLIPFRPLRWLVVVPRVLLMLVASTTVTIHQKRHTTQHCHQWAQHHHHHLHVFLRRLSRSA